MKLFQPNSYLLGLLSASILFVFSSSVTQAVMPPKSYDVMAQASSIKAVAIVQDVKVLEETKQSTRKKIIFKLEKSFGDTSLPEFQGTCFSVDHAWQNPGEGGTIYYYPKKGDRVLVTVNNNNGSITSYTQLLPEIEKEIRENGLKNISFAMGRASIQVSADQKEKKQWFLFYLDNKPTGYLSIGQKKAPESSLPIEFTHELLVGKLDGDRKLYTVITNSQQDDTLTPGQMTIEVTGFTTGKRVMLSKRAISFHTVAKGHVPEGILTNTNLDTVDVAIPPATTTDFLLFSLIEKLPFESRSSMRLNLIESLEVHLKKNIVVSYEGKDEQNRNLHKFVHAQATYWLNAQHQLVEVHWDSDKFFMRGTKTEAMTILQ